MRLIRPLLGLLTAIAITTSMDATGLSAFSALPLFPLLFLFRYLDGLSFTSLGFIWGRRSHYGLAVLYPVGVLGLLAALAFLAGAADPAHAHWGKTCRDLALVAVSTTLAVIITEEGFFRGWLWASLQKAGLTAGQTLLGTSLAFSLWHFSAVALPTGFDLPAAQIPVFMINAAVMGAIWGLLRLISGSILVASVSHGLWNGGAYVLFGFGTKAGALGIRNTVIFGPEVGLLGLLLNLLCAVALWQWWRKRGTSVTGRDPADTVTALPN